MLTTSSLEFRYSGNRSFIFPDLRCGRGEVLLVLGRSGSGKTTLLSLVAGLLRPVSGSVRIDGEEIHRMTSAARDRFRGRQIGMVFQHPHFVSALTARHNLLLAQRLGGHRREPAEVDALLQKLEISHIGDNFPSNLSQGEKQRLSIARALVNHPGLVLADEPTSSLDDQHCNEVISLLRQKASEDQAALVVVTHDLRLKNLFPNQVVL